MNIPSPSLVQRLLLSSLVAFFVIQSWGALNAEARGFSAHREEDHLVSNGQGVSSPSFWDGLSGENPAGLTYNGSLKLQGGMATFDNSLDHHRESGALLIGNGLLGAGLEYSTYNSGPYPAGSAQINWGIAGFLTGISTAVGVSGHHVSGSSNGIYDLGLLIQMSQVLRLGVLLPNFTNDPRLAGAGLTLSIDPSIDLVLDSSMNFGSGTLGLMLKPGVSLHSEIFQLTAAYGPDMSSSPTLLYRGFTGGLGIKLSRAVLIGYEYKGMPEHRLGLTLKLN